MRTLLSIFLCNLVPVLASAPEAWPYWPEYEKTPLADIVPQPWRASDDVIDGWDWSMPPEVQPAPHSLMGLQRVMGLNKPIEKIEANFPVNAVTLLWINWRDIEPKEGVYRWDLVQARISEAQYCFNRLLGPEWHSANVASRLCWLCLAILW